jgi:WD40 repeat protein
MAVDLVTSLDRQERLEQAIGTYLEALDAGLAPDPDEWLARHSDLRPELAAFLADQDHLDHLVGPLRQAVAGDGQDPTTVRSAPQVQSADAPRPEADETTELPPGQEPPEEPPPPPGDDDQDDQPRGARVRYFGDYELKRVLGRGGMGVVYSAKQLSLNRPVALKMIRAGVLADEAEQRRFQNEAEAVAQLDHPGIVPIYEVGEHLGQRYFAMKLVPGDSLAALLDRYRDDPLSTARLVAEAAEAVHHAHLRGILHRDLKPANILVDEQGHPHVTDFGLAKRVEGDSELTQSGAILGTPAYMAPEQASGRRGTVTTASDVYGLGAILYALLAGHAPFRGDSVVETLDAVRTRPPEPPTRLNPQVPRDLEVICLKCLEKDPRQRYASTRALAEDLRHHLAGEPIAARPVGPAQRVWMWCRRRPALAGLVTALALSLLAGTIVSSTLAILARAEARRADGEAAKAFQAASRADREADQAIRAKKLGDRRLYAAHMNLIKQAWERGDVGQVRELLRQHFPGPDAEDLRGFEWAYFDRLCRPDFLTLPGAAAISPDGRLIAQLGSREPGQRLTFNSRYKNTVIRIWDAAEGREISQMERPRNLDGSYFRSSDFSPDGRLFAIVCDRAPTESIGSRILVYEVATGQLISELHGYLSIVNLEFRPDGRRIAACDRTRIVVWNVETGKELYVTRVATWCLAFSPNGSILATGGLDDGKLRLRDSSSGEEFRVLDLGQLGIVWDVEFSPDGRQVAAMSQDGEVRIWEVNGATDLPTLKMAGARVTTTIAYSSDGQHLVGAGGLINLWDTKDGRLIRTYRGAGGSGARFWPDAGVIATPDAGDIATPAVRDGVQFCDTQSDQEATELPGTSLAVSPDGRLAALDEQWNFTQPGGNRILLFDLDKGLERIAIRGLPKTDSGFAAAFDRQARRLAVGNVDAIQIWDTTRGTELLRIPRAWPDRIIHGLMFSPDGTRLFARFHQLTRDPRFGVLPAPVELRVWDATSGTLIQSSRWDLGKNRTSALSLDGRWIALPFADGSIRVLELEGGREVYVLSHPPVERVSSLAFSADGRQLAAALSSDVERASEDSTTSTGYRICIWELKTGQSHSFNTHQIAGEVGFSPDGARIIDFLSGLRLWDPVTGLQLLSLPEPRPWRTGGWGMDPSGRRVVLGQTLWDALPEDSTARTRRVASARLRSWLRLDPDRPRIPTRAVLTERIRRDFLLQLQPDARRVALSLLNEFRDACILREADRVVASHLARPMTPAEAGEAIRAAAGLDDDVRRVALELARRYPPDVWAIIFAAREVAARPGKRPAEYERALRMSETALAASQGSDTFEGIMMNTVGWLQYRLGRLEQARVVLERSAAINPGDEYFQYSDAYDAVILALVAHDMGHEDRARKYLQRARTVTGSDAELLQMIREAEAVIEPDLTIPDNPFAP